MDDYLIGIRLALDNGVSAGLASIRADLAALDTAIATSAEGLRALSEFSASAPMPVQQAVPRPALPASAEQAPAAPPMLPTSISANAQGTPPISAPIVRIDPPQSAPLAPLQMPLPPTPNSGTIPRDQSSPALQPAAAPVINLTATASRMTPPQMAAAPASSNWPTAPSAPVQTPDSAVGASSPPSTQPTSYAPPPTQSPNASSGGDVYLDGERLGHWVSNHLTREANRPSYGGTGFDPSLSIAWPGAAQGGN